MKKSKVYEISDQDFIQVVSTNRSYSAILRVLGMSDSGGGSIKKVKQRISDLGLDIGHFKNSGGGTTRRYKMSEILIDNSPYQSIHRLKERLVSEGYKEYSCVECGISEWLGLPISLQLHHKNGINNDHRLSNIDFMCPNCHAQTDNYAGKNTTKHKNENNCIVCGVSKSNVSNSGMCTKCSYESRRVVSRPNRNELLDDIIRSGFLATGRKYGVSDNAIRKWCKSLSLPTTKRGIAQLVEH